MVVTTYLFWKSNYVAYSLKKILTYSVGLLPGILKTSACAAGKYLIDPVPFHTIYTHISTLVCAVEHAAYDLLPDTGNSKQ